MSEKKWNLFSWMSIIIGISLIVGVDLYNGRSNLHFTLTTGILIGVSLLLFCFVIFDYIRKHVTKGVTGKTFVYTILIIILIGICLVFIM